MFLSGKIYFGSAITDPVTNYVILHLIASYRVRSSIVNDEAGGALLMAHTVWLLVFLGGHRGSILGVGWGGVG